MSSSPHTPASTPPASAAAASSARGDGDDDTVTDAYAGDARLTPLEAQVLAEWARLSRGLEGLAARLATLAEGEPARVGDALRMLERKTALVCTALKSSVYGILLRQQIEFGDGGGDGEADGAA